MTATIAGIDVDDQRRQRDRDVLEARVVRPGVGRVEDAERNGDERRPAIEQPQPAPSVRPGEHPEPRQQRAEAEPPRGQHVPADALLVDGLGEEPARAEAAGGHEDQGDPDGMAAIHRRRLAGRGPTTLAA